MVYIVQINNRGVADMADNRTCTHGVRTGVCVSCKVRALTALYFDAISFIRDVEGDDLSNPSQSAREFLKGLDGIADDYEQGPFCSFCGLSSNWNADAPDSMTIGFSDGYPIFAHLDCASDAFLE